MTQFLLSVLFLSHVFAGINHSRYAGAIVESFDEKRVKVKVVNRHFWISRTNLEPEHLKVGQMIILPVTVADALKNAEPSATTH